MLVDHLEDQFKPNREPRDVNFVYDVCYTIRDWLNAPTAREMIQIATPYEVKDLIKRLKVKKAPGHDSINNYTIKKLPDNCIAKITSIINACLYHRYFPPSWKHAKIILLPKPDKDATKPEGYRPISLLSGFGKLYERIIFTRIKPHLHILPHEQFGFRKSLSTTKQLVRLVEFCGDAIHKKQNVALLMLDVAKAFDRVWHEGLIYKLIQQQMKRELIELIVSFITNRKFTVSVGQDLSTIRDIAAGVPQGSILCPILYLMYVADFPNPQRGDNYFMGCYADDTALAVKSANAKHAITKLQDMMPNIEEWCTKWRISINAQKSQLLIIRRKHRKVPIRKKLYLLGSEVPQVNNAKYLGVVLNDNLTWKDNTANIRRKANGVINNLKPLLGKFSPLDLRRKRDYSLNPEDAEVRPLAAHLTRDSNFPT
ncbi:RNA-directed DNA polymerase from mobile element jockey, partial [Stegodyphus mimosarum]